MRRPRYRGQARAHLPHVLAANTVIAANTERLGKQPRGESALPRPPTAFQDHHDQQGIPRLRSWRAVS
ncbi:hypothetical protein KNE206_68370 [Kitasatospora sp. NE20-6]|uniref:hypothetical protein n=1 Tax=Kitasatospora sp. NE20-6 TaxID=2859066 RepID=UPI0034DC97EE